MVSLSIVAYPPPPYKISGLLSGKQHRFLYFWKILSIVSHGISNTASHFRGTLLNLLYALHYLLMVYIKRQLSKCVIIHLRLNSKHFPIICFKRRLCFQIVAMFAIILYKYKKKTQWKVELETSPKSGRGGWDTVYKYSKNILKFRSI